jgi:molybdopterin-guanine dinucleotide biosynthesis protein B
MKRIAVGFTGPSNSGKTTIIEKVARKLKQKGYRVVVIKNDPKDKAIFDYEGKDSWKFSQTGADVVVVSPKRTTYFAKHSLSFEEILNLIGEFDYLLVEGLRDLPLPKIGVFYKEVDMSYLKYVSAIATKDRDLQKLDIEILDIDSADEVIDWIDKKGKIL